MRHLREAAALVGVQVEEIRVQLRGGGHLFDVVAVRNDVLCNAFIRCGVTQQGGFVIHRPIAADAEDLLLGGELDADADLVQDRRRAPDSPSP